MNKRSKYFLIGYLAAGTVFLIIGLAFLTGYYSTLLCSIGFGMIFSTIMQFVMAYRNTRPEHIDAYREKIRQQRINLKDERKVQLRFRAGYITWKYAMIGCFAASFLAAVLNAPPAVTASLAAAAFVQYAAALCIYRYLCKKE